VAQRFTAAINGLFSTPASAAAAMLPREKHHFRRLFHSRRRVAENASALLRLRHASIACNDFFRKL
jgi:hypothetical protein